MNRVSLRIGAAAALAAAVVMLSVAAFAAAPPVAAPVSTTLRGTGNQTPAPVKLTQGVYVVTWSGKTDMMIMATGAGSDVPAMLSATEASGTCLFAVDGVSWKAGNTTFDVTTEGAWTVTLTKVVGPGVALPQTLSSTGAADVISAPFKAAAGKLAVKYAYTGTPQMMGGIGIFDIVTGKVLPSPNLLDASGTAQVSVAAPGVYVAQAYLPMGATGETLTISQ
jgi:hypothetical protein